MGILCILICTAVWVFKSARLRWDSVFPTCVLPLELTPVKSAWCVNDFNPSLACVTEQEGIRTLLAVIRPAGNLKFVPSIICLPQFCCMYALSIHLLKVQST